MVVYIARKSISCGHIDHNAEMFEVYQSMTSYLTLQIKKLEAQIRVVMDSDSSLKKTYGLLTSMKGIGPVIAANMITSTHNFTRFANWRKFSCYIGTAPFEHTSGTSVKRKTQVSHLTNKQLKKLLHLAAISAIIHNKELKAYYLRRVNEGKSRMSTSTFFAIRSLPACLLLLTGSQDMWN